MSVRVRARFKEHTPSLSLFFLKTQSHTHSFVFSYSIFRCLRLGLSGQFCFYAELFFGGGSKLIELIKLIEGIKLIKCIKCIKCIKLIEGSAILNHFLFGRVSQALC